MNIISVPVPSPGHQRSRPAKRLFLPGIGLRRGALALSLAAAFLLGGCAGPRSEGPKAKVSTPQLKALGDHSFPITTSSPAAQRSFDRGLTFAYAFMHHAAEEEFRRAAEADPGCAMAYWGIALVNGPHINYAAVPAPRAAKAWDALVRAQELAAGAAPLEQALIRALSRRYADPQPEDRAPLDRAYAAAMRELWQAYPKHADVGTLCAEALMDLHPWDLWTNDGQPQPWTPEIIAILEDAIELNPRHPGANHLYIHAVEASPQPEKGIVAADRLRRLVPDASHLVHMPAHIYARVGRWSDAAQSNRDAMRADVRYRAAYPRPGFYALYMAHNTHFLAFAAMMQGRSEEALRAAREMVAAIPEDFLRDHADVADAFMIFVSEALMRFGRWDEILAAPEPRADLYVSRALWRFTRASSLGALGRLDEARAEQAAFETAAAAVPPDRRCGNNSAADVLAIARRVLAGELAAQNGEIETSIALLREAAALEDQLRYDEPPDWIQPVRHTLGAVLLRANRPAEAEQVYLEDLRRFPENGWALMGLRDSLHRQEKHLEAETADARFKKAWATADIRPPSTCYCQDLSKPVSPRALMPVGRTGPGDRDRDKD